CARWPKTRPSAFSRRASSWRRWGWGSRGVEVWRYVGGAYKDTAQSRNHPGPRFARETVAARQRRDRHVSTGLIVAAKMLYASGRGRGVNLAPLRGARIPPERILRTLPHATARYAASPTSHARNPPTHVHTPYPALGFRKPHTLTTGTAKMRPVC